MDDQMRGWIERFIDEFFWEASTASSYDLFEKARLRAIEKLGEYVEGQRFIERRNAAAERLAIAYNENK